MKIDLDAEMMRSIVAESLMASLDEQKRTALIQGAIQHLITPQGNAYGGGKSPLVEAFNMAAGHVARSIIADELIKDETFVAKIRGMIVEATERITTTNRDAVIQKMADAIESGLTDRRY
jgi:hypothetical protein